MTQGEISEQGVRNAVAKVLRELANSYDKYPNNIFTGCEVAHGLKLVAMNLETKKKATIIRP